MRRTIPSALTTIGLAAGLLGLSWWPDPLAVILLAASLSLDGADGWAARSLDAVTRAGAELDWHTDCALGILAAWIAFGAVAAAALVAYQALNRSRGVKSSGRALAFVLASGAALLQS